MKVRFGLFLPIAAWLLASIAASLWATRYPARLDLTRHNVYSLSEASREIAAAVPRPVEITFFHDARSQAMRDARHLLEQLAAASSKITLRVSDPVKHPALAEAFDVRFAGTTVLDSGGRRVTVYGATETEFVNGLIRATRSGAVRLCATTGHVESDPYSLESHDHSEAGGHAHHDHSSGGRALRIHERHGLGMARRALETLGYTVEDRRLTEGEEPLRGCSIALVASPQVRFLPEEVAHLERFLAAGHGALLLLEPGIESGLESILANYGLELSTTPVRDPARHYGTDPATPAVSDYPRHRITRNLPLTFFPGVAALAPTDNYREQRVSVAPLLESSPESRLAGDPAPAARTLGVSVRTNDGRGPIVVTGDGDFATNTYFHVLGNGQLFLNAVNALAENEDLIDLVPRHYQDATIELTNRQMLATFLVATVALPSVLLLIGGFVWWRGR